ncbi:hypothetical protein DYBT9623_00958 [Dyadobacter sp. CECT 9623]|uniref:HTH cro/C1-type domain-containing protein n=1 Tax=Dyadobacter linearis TaxID=2823330 RepID=A0ABN7R4C9_9BACT|nr:helix-turn-helix transcriptional regulator [Dyadobacter sp. CECT 9623]CAG5068229.1 hypothetical protein DYBT9623_00958 [Dyadobacter sp. CECT 9623]
MNILASNLLTRREEKRLTQTYVALKCGMSQPNYSAIERGKTDPSISQLKKFAEVLDTTVDDLISEKPRQNPILGHKNILTESDKDIYIKILENQLRALMAERKKGQ